MVATGEVFDLTKALDELKEELMVDFELKLKKRGLGLGELKEAHDKARRNANFLAMGAYTDYNDLADIVAHHRAALKDASTDEQRMAAIAQFVSDFDEDGQLSSLGVGKARAPVVRFDVEVPPPPPAHTVLDVPTLVSRFNRGKDGVRITMASGTNTGKSFLAASMAKEMVDTGRVAGVYVLSDDPETALACYDPVLGDALVDVSLFSDEAVGELKKQQETARRSKSLNKVLLIVDDVCAADKSAQLMMSFQRGRHVGLSVFLLNQVANRAIAPWAKGNSEFILFSMLTPAGVKTLHDAMVLASPMSHGALSAWVADHVGGAPHTPTRYVFGVYDRDYHVLYKVKK